MRHFLAALFLGSLIAACSGGATAPAGPRIAEAQPDDLTCSRDEDCALVDDCCGCAAGGTKTAVRTDRVDALSAAADSSCDPSRCSGLASEHRSCEAVGARCAGGRCVPRL
jgi:hypothetical protein